MSWIAAAILVLAVVLAQIFGLIGTLDRFPLVKSFVESKSLQGVFLIAAILLLAGTAVQLHQVLNAPPPIGAKVPTVIVQAPTLPNEATAPTKTTVTKRGKDSQATTGNTQTMTNSPGAQQAGRDIQNNFRDPLPLIDVTPSVPIAAGDGPVAAIQTGEYPPNPFMNNPGASVTITLKGSFRTPAFAADCNIPCALTGQLIVEGDRNGSLSSQFKILQVQGNMAGVIAYNVQMYPGSTIRLTFRSLDSRALTVSNVRSYDPIH